MMQPKPFFYLLVMSVVGSVSGRATAQSQNVISSQNSELLSAAGKGDLEKVRRSLEAGANPNVVNDRGMTPLIATAGWETYDYVESGKEERHSQIVTLLLGKGAKIDAQDNRGATALMWATAKGHAETARILINHGANVNLEDKQGRTALTLATPRGVKDRGLVQPLLKRGARIRLIEALLFADTAKARALVSGANLQAHGPYNETPLMLAAFLGDPSLVKALLSRAVEVNASDDRGFTALMMANGATPYTSMPGGFRGWKKFGKKSPRTEVVSLLLASGAKPNRQNTVGETALHWATELGYLAIAEVLLKQGADPNVQNKRGETPLCLAVATNHFSLVKLLLDKGADPNAGQGTSLPLLRAVVSRQPNPKIITLLLSKGAPIDQISEGRTLLMWVANEGIASTITLLLSKGAKVNLANEDGMTALMFASGWNQPGVVKALLFGGADISFKSKDGLTALDFALAKERTENVKWLK